MDDETPTRAPSLSEAETRSLEQDVRQLGEDARSLAEAEFAYQKARASYAGGEAKTIAILGVFALFFIFFALMALVVGTVIALGPSLGPWGATAAVTGALVLLVVVCAAGIVWRIKTMKSVLSNKDSQ